MNAVIAKCGQMQRRLKKGQRLTGEALEFALSVLPPNIGNANDASFVGMAQKLVSSQGRTRS